ncbi:NAD(P)/FAD-dependent oxidoreductase [Erwinia psidii]|uniref:FAD-binding oxidoreductase n=1 Tax=Erwinia psidii TaxID=69224 RepID=A0A3N6SHX5_9GAMM|nr:FAD-dependent oxidoreductase [Erwinia psidii]MCX8957641.1 FAD-binding oxidoreductase [Erwinia psidii]MCX8960695.1 FAD-binding oxidoreductase [Erwinia psidii]MCX8964060.1 FAD-binding oxidoreductase [Erwinia psidii]RQM39543.1 FAD-binding oxidoreductase [Erwinia psidii]
MLKYDIAIVGGGILGSTIARELINNYPKLTIAVIDKKLSGAGASFYSAGVHFPRGGSEKVRKMSAYSHDYYQSLINDGAPIYPLAMELITESGNRPRVEEKYLPLVGFHQLANCSSDIIDLTAAAGDDLRVLKGNGANYANVFALVNYYMHSLRDNIDYLEGTEVESIQRDTNGYLLSLRSGVNLHARQTIVVPGPWVNHPLCHKALSASGIRVKKIVAAHINVTPTEQAPLIVFDEEDAFLLPCHHRKQWLFSYTCKEWDVDPETIRALTAADLANARDTLAKYAPALADQIHDGRVFCDAYSPGSEPTVIRANDGVIYAAGCNGSGYRLAPAIAAEVIHLMLHLSGLEK